MTIIKRPTILVILLCSTRIDSMEFLRTAARSAVGANFAAELGRNLAESSRAIANGYQNGTQLRLDAKTRQTLDSLANMNHRHTIVPATFNAASRLTKQAGFTVGGAGLMLGGVYMLSSWANRYFEKTTPISYNDYAVGAFSFAAFFAGAALIYQSDKIVPDDRKILKNASTETGPLFQNRRINRRNSIN